MPQGSSAVKPTKGLYLYLFSLGRGRIGTEICGSLINRYCYNTHVCKAYKVSVLPYKDHDGQSGQS